MGQISAAGAAATGLQAGTPVVAGAGDQAAGAIGMGVVSSGTVSATIGTSGVVLAATRGPALDPKGRLHTFCHAVPGRWMVMGVTQAAGLSLRWFRDQFGAGTNGHTFRVILMTPSLQMRRTLLRDATVCSGLLILWASARPTSTRRRGEFWLVSRRRTREPM